MVISCVPFEHRGVNLHLLQSNHTTLLQSDDAAGELSAEGGVDAGFHEELASEDFVTLTKTYYFFPCPFLDSECPKVDTSILHLR